MVRWMRDLEQQRLAKIVTSVNGALAQSMGKSQPNPGFEKVGPLASNAQTVLLHCRFLELLFRTNQMKERVPCELFKNKAVILNTDPAGQFKRHFRGEKLMNFLRFPFLLNLEYLNVHLDIT